MKTKTSRRVVTIAASSLLLGVATTATAATTVDNVGEAFSLRGQILGSLDSNGTTFGKEAEGKCGEGKCGEGKCGEGKCGEGKCGEGKCGGDDTHDEE